MKNFEDLIVFQKSMDLADAVYDATTAWPSSERFGLTTQIQRASVSIFPNIAEGQGRNGPKEFVHFLSLSYGSLMEVRAQLLFAKRRKYLTESSAEPLLQLAVVVAKLLNALMRSLSR